MGVKYPDCLSEEAVAESGGHGMDALVPSATGEVMPQWLRL